MFSNKKASKVETKNISTNEYFNSITRNRFIYWICITVFAITFLTLSLSLNYTGRLFHNLSYVSIDAEGNPQGYVQMAAFQYFTYLCFATLTLYYAALSMSHGFSLMKGEMNEFEKSLLNPIFKNTLVFMFITMFAIVILILGPQLLFAPELGGPSADASSSGKSLPSWVPMLTTMLIHIVLPILVFIDHFTLTPIKEMKDRSWWWFIIPPISYMSIAIPIGVAQTASMGFQDLGYGVYPYFFMDPQIVGIAGVIFINLGLYAVSLPLAYALMWHQNNMVRESKSLDKNKFNFFNSILGDNNYNYIKNKFNKK